MPSKINSMGKPEEISIHGYFCPWIAKRGQTYSPFFTGEPKNCLCLFCGYVHGSKTLVANVSILMHFLAKTFRGMMGHVLNVLFPLKCRFFQKWRLSALGYPPADFCCVHCACIDSISVVTCVAKTISVKSHILDALYRIAAMFSWAQLSEPS